MPDTITRRSYYAAAIARLPSVAELDARQAAQIQEYAAALGITTAAAAVALRKSVRR